MLSEEEKQTIEYLKARLYGNEGCKIIDVAQSDLRIFLKLVENLQKDIENWKKYCNEQENDITLKNNKICDLEFHVEKQSKEIEELKNITKSYDSFLGTEKIVIADKKFFVNGYFQENYVSKDKIKSKIDYLLKHYDSENFINFEMFIKILQSLLEKE